MLQTGDRVRVVDGLFKNDTGTVRLLPNDVSSDYGVFMDESKSIFWFPRKDIEPLNTVSVTCECGTTKAMGREDHPQYHSYWCPVSVKYKGEVDKK